MLKRTTGQMPAAASLATNEYRITVFTTAFQVRGLLRVPGVLQTYMNDVERPTISVFNAQMTGFDPNNPAGRINVPELIIRKTECGIIAFEDQIPSDSMKLLPRGEYLAVYTDRFIAEGEFHMGADSRLTDFIDISLQQFILAVNVKVYPLIQPRVTLVPFAPLVAIQKVSIKLYHATPSSA